jgi:light-regulated signal transduction histidine kinase (bacteriophytochrome)
MNSALACPSNYNLAIQDNGIGFTDANFDRFSRLLKVDSSNHKGLGRLIYRKHAENPRVSTGG